MPLSIIPKLRMPVKIVFFTVILVFFQVTATLADLKSIRDKGVIRHLGVRYARFVSGSGDGFSTDLIKGFANELGVRYEYVETSWQSVITDLTGKTYRIVNGKVETTGEGPIKAMSSQTG